MSSDVETIPLILNRPSDATDVARIRFENRYRDPLFREEISGCETSWPGADNNDLTFNC
jgi:hypothetical protein